MGAYAARQYSAMLPDMSPRWAGVTMGPRSRRWQRAIEPAAVLLVLLLCGLYALANLVEVTARWEFDDIHAYLAAGQRLLDGGPLYVTTPDPSDLYLYAPWFAFAWAPLTGLPQLAVETGWAVLLVVATVAALIPFRHSWSGIAVALLMGGLLFRTAGWGNVQPLLVAGLVYALPTRLGPWAVGVAGSLKPWPLLAVLVYAWRRQWSAMAISLGVAAVLWLPILLFDVSSYPAGQRVPNLYDATILLAVPSLLRGHRS